LETILKETRVFTPSDAFRSQAHFSSQEEYNALRAKASKDPEAFWDETARNHLHWFEPWHTTLQWEAPYAKWFIGGKTNAAYNCLDRHLAQHGNKQAILWEGENGDTRTYTYSELHASVCRLSLALQNELGLKAGDTAAIYLPLIPEAIIAMLACARIGVTHSVIFGGFSSHAIRDRVQDAGCKVVFTADKGYRRGAPIELSRAVADALPECPSVEKVIVLQREGMGSLPPKWIDWETLCARQTGKHAALPLDSEHPLFFLYTSGTTGKPKGIVHSTGGYLTNVVATTQWVLDIKHSDVYWCTADVGWITGHSYLVYGPLANAATLLLYEGGLSHPQPGRIWELIQKYRVTILYTAPTAIRSFMREGDAVAQKQDLSSLRLLGSVGEPINPEAWMWYHRTIGKERCPIVDTWWQTETGGMLIAGTPGAVPQKPGSASLPLPGIAMDIVDENGVSCPPNQGGYLIIRHPWPSMLRGIHRDPQRFQSAYFSRFPGIYFTGDGAHRDEDGYFWIKGRVDDVLNVSGHRLGTMEIESALVSHPQVAEAAVVGRADALKGQAVVAFVIPRGETDALDKTAFKKALKAHVAKEIGSLARPDEIFLTKSLPKTRSGKIMRRLLRDLAEGKTQSGDTTTLENPGLVDLIPD
jgi:acetyl-CoA synthetase